MFAIRALFGRRHGQDRPIMYGDKHYSEDNKRVRSLRKLVEFIDQRYSNVSIVVLLAHTAMELVSVGFYVWTSQVTAATRVYEFHWNLGVFITEVVLNIIFVIEWIALFIFEDDKKTYFFSWLSIVNWLTSVPMIIVGIGALVDSRWRSGWVPMYFRMWWVNDCFSLLLDYEQLSHLFIDVYREIARFFMHLFAVMCTCIGTHQIVESCSGMYMDLYNSFYMMVVAFATIGYGDVTPKTTPARIFMTGFVIIGVCYFLPMFARLAKVGQEKQLYSTFRSHKWWGERRNHVILTGQFSDTSFEVLLRSFYSGWRRYLSTKVIVLSPDEYTPEVKLIAMLPWYKDRVKLMIGDPAKESDLRRADAAHADAIFLFGNTKSSAYYSDFDIITQALAVGLLDPELPQHLALRRGRTVKQIAPFAASVFETERTVHNLIGLSLVVPGVIPLIINLLRSYEPLPSDTTLNSGWVEQYEFSLRNDLHAITVPDTLRGREFRVLARSFFELGVTLIGILNAHSEVQLNPHELVPNAKKLILIARSRDAAEEATMVLSRNYEQTFGEEMLVAPDPDAYDEERRKRRAATMHLTAFEDSSAFESYGAHDDGGIPTYSDDGAADEQPHRSLEQIADALEYGNHFIVIDMTSAKAKDQQSRHAQESSLTAVAHDLYHIMSPIRQAYPMNDIVLLTNDVSFAPYFDQYWAPRENTPSVKYIIGSGLNVSDLRRCNVEHCGGCCIVYSGDISRGGSTSAMSMLVVLSIQDILKGLPSFPLVVELEGLLNLPWFPPHAEDPRLRVKAESDFVFEPNFTIGNAVSRMMLFPTLLQNYFMDEFIDIVNVLVGGHSPDVPALSQMPLSMCDADLETYQDVVQYCLQVGFLPIALHRLITDVHNPSISGHRFVLTNPPKALPINQATDFIFYITPG